MIRFAGILLIVFAISNSVLAQSQKKYGVANDDNKLPQGLSVGEFAPDFKLKTSEGEEIVLSRELEKGPVVLVFYRGKWCGHCIRYLSAIQDSLDLIYSVGAQIFAISPEISENAEKTKTSSGAEFPVLIDENDKAMDAYDVGFEVTSTYANKVAVGKMTSLSSANDQETARLPVPATYVIDSKGIIRFVQFDFNYRYEKRASVKKIMEVLEEMEN